MCAYGTLSLTAMWFYYNKCKKNLNENPQGKSPFSGAREYLISELSQLEQPTVWCRDSQRCESWAQKFLVPESSWLQRLFADSL